MMNVPMLQNKSEPATSVDAKTAEEALALAVRLQQEKGDRVSIEELQRTADEAGIDRESLHRALHQVSTTAVVPAPRRRINALPIVAMSAVVMIVLSKSLPFHSPAAIGLQALGSAIIFGVSFAFMALVRQHRSGPGG